MVTEPDDIVKIEDEMRRQVKERRKRAERVREQSKNMTHELPGAFRWFQDDDEKLIDNATNLTYGTWVWCKNDTCVPHPPSRGSHPPSRGSVTQGLRMHLLSSAALSPPPPICPPLLHSHPPYPCALPAPRACANTDGSAAHMACAATTHVTTAILMRCTGKTVPLSVLQ